MRGNEIGERKETVQNRQVMERRGETKGYVMKVKMEEKVNDGSTEAVEVRKIVKGDDQKTGKKKENCRQSTLQTWNENCRRE